ncbi:Anaerobic regulatory protein [Lentibacillus sp. JNUCC-1]|uniref:Crp/Fnr family transcriptional regulator n=1 Tax=Lentibacillus sp. JNUCC-1 TaxID=2654513 RepID=UPI00132B6D6D|nr:Crp/Fnr family transcriptional regulator [Lentibacillus sp. JNUCC-1]MUV36738.1 Anaerobic regulatory protein [Lentibacillus sp. JNUCC-1]
MQTARRNEELISEDLHALLISLGTIRRVRSGDFLFSEGMPAEYIYMVKSGLLQIGKLSEDGKELTLRICQEGALVGELVLFSDDATYLLNAKALKESEVYSISKKELETAFMENSLLAFEFMKWASNHMRMFQYKIRDLLLHGKKGALYSTLIRLSNSYGIEQNGGILIDVPLTDTELASFAAATRESANRMLNDLRSRSIVATDDSGKIFIKDLQYLRKQIGCEDCPLVICHID